MAGWVTVLPTSLALSFKKEVRVNDSGLTCELKPRFVFGCSGLPHAHIIIWLASRPSIDEVDSYVCAEIPDPEVYPLLHATVTRCMMHGPCGPGSSCFGPNGMCTKGFPKEYADETHLPENSSRVVYRRRSPANGGRTFERIRGGRVDVLDNGNVVPYNPFLSKLLDCHINVEIVTSLGAIKYLFVIFFSTHFFLESSLYSVFFFVPQKYIYKGDDRINFSVRAEASGRPSAPAAAAADDDDRSRDEPDEIARYLSARYMGPPSAIWRLRSFPLFSMSHTVFRLQVHLPGQQNVCFNGREEGARHALERNSATPLTRSFQSCLDRFETHTGGVRVVGTLNIVMQSY